MDNTRFFIIPYVHKISKQFMFNIKDIKLCAAFIGLNKLYNMIKIQKDKLAHGSQSDVVYRIDCRDYDASQVGQTKRQLKIRINEHRQQLARKPKDYSVVSQHRLSGHEFEWDNVKILNREKFYTKRLVSEVFCILSEQLEFTLRH